MRNYFFLEKLFTPIKGVASHNVLHLNSSPLLISQVMFHAKNVQFKQLPKVSSALNENLTFLVKKRRSILTPCVFHNAARIGISIHVILSIDLDLVLRE